VSQLEPGLEHKKGKKAMDMNNNKDVNMDELIKEINALANKKKTVGLTEEEQVKQDALRKKYLEIFRGNLKQQLANTKIKTPDGKLHPLKYMPQNPKKMH